MYVEDEVIVIRLLQWYEIILLAIKVLNRLVNSKKVTHIKVANHYPQVNELIIKSTQTISNELTDIKIAKNKEEENITKT